jgi:hypothetical protein
MRLRPRDRQFRHGPANASIRVSAAVSSRRRLLFGALKPAISRRAGMPCAAKLAWSEFGISGRCVAIGRPARPDVSLTHASSLSKPDVSAVNPDAPPTESRLTLMTIDRRSASSIWSSQMRDPTRPHSSALNRQIRKPRGHLLTCGASRRKSSSATTTPVALSIALSPCGWPSIWALTTTQSEPWPGRSAINMRVRAG